VGRQGRIALKVGVWAAGLAPLAALGWWAWTSDLTANPISFITNWLGDWTLRILLLSLSMTPLRLSLGWSWPVTLRRLLGLFAFAYAALHFSVWLVIDHFFDWPEMGADIVKRPYVTLGMTALIAMVPLAATSTAGMIRRLGGTAWRRLHRLAYVAGVAAVLHFLWLAKVGRRTPYYYAAWLAVALGIRLVDALRRRARRRATGPSTRPALARPREGGARAD
jgi:sulfoxide reductase heme-binding subunit YedZ